MTFKRWLAAAVAAVAGIILLFYYVLDNGTVADELRDRLLLQEKISIRLWYSDDALTAYLTARAVEYNETHAEVRAEPVLVTDPEFLEAVNKASLEGEASPDLYIITNDALEKAQLSGLALDVPKPEGFLNTEMFPEAAIRAVTYNGRPVAYPYYYECSALLYNRSYLEETIRDEIETEKIEAHPEALAGDEALQVSAEEIEARMPQVIPDTMTDLLAFAQSYNAPEEVEAVFRWDVTDIFYNYFFAGNYMNVGGDAGDNPAEVDLYNADVIRCMKLYQELNQFFAVDPYDIDYDLVMDDFIAGRSVFTIATSDAVTRIRTAQEEGNTSYTFGAAPIPKLTDELSTRTMSVTDCLVVNGYSEHPDAAHAFAKYLVNMSDETMFDQTGKPPVRRNVQYKEPMLETFSAAYSGSVPLPKMIGTSNLWMRLEIAFTQIWNGADPNATLKELSETIKKQIVGSDYVEMLLPDPEVPSLTEGLSEEDE